MDAPRFTRLLQRMATHHVATPADLHGASELEIAALETRYALKLPATYRHYFATMGHRSGRLFTHDHQAVFYRYVLQLTADLRQEYPREITIPADALVVAGRLGSAWEFIRCNSENDSPVWYFDESNWRIRPRTIRFSPGSKPGVLPLKRPSPLVTSSKARVAPRRS